MQPKYLYIRGVQLLGAWAINFCALTLNIFTIFVAVNSFSFIKICISSNEQRIERQATLRLTGRSRIVDPQHGPYFTSPF
jgi:hypothetical protein